MVALSLAGLARLLCLLSVAAYDDSGLAAGSAEVHQSRLPFEESAELQSLHHHKHQHPFPGPSNPHEQQDQQRPDKLRIAVLGAGAAGSSTVYFLNFLSEKGLLPHLASLDLYEKEDYIGGRSTTIVLPFGPVDEPAPVAELGASIFVEKNRHLAHAVKTFNLTTQSGHGGGRIEDALMAVWDGEKYVYQDSGGWGVWNLFKLWWKYGTSPLHARNLMRNMLQRFLNIYSPSFQSDGPYRTMADFAERANFSDLFEIDGQRYLEQHGVSSDFTSDLIAAGTTVNYAQTPKEMHALETLVSIAAEGASSVKGGNRLIFEHMARARGAAVHLQQPVTSLKKLQTSVRADGAKSGPVEWEVTSQHLITGQKTSKTYDIVVVAAPWHRMKMQVSSAEAKRRAGAPVDYVDLHVTLVVTNATAPQACFFNPHWACRDAAPKTVLATLAPWQAGKVHTQPRVNSLNYLQELEPGKFAVKIFSRHVLSDLELQEAFGLDNVLWSHRQPWLSYPFVRPLKPHDFGSLHLDEGLYYTSPMEQLISTMETSSISAWNIASLIVADYTPHRVKKSWPDWDAGD